MYTTPPTGQWQQRPSSYGNVPGREATFPGEPNVAQSVKGKTQFSETALTLHRWNIALTFADVVTQITRRVLQVRRILTTSASDLLRTLRRHKTLRARCLGSRPAPSCARIGGGYSGLQSRNFRK